VGGFWQAICSPAEVIEPRIQSACSIASSEAYREQRGIEMEGSVYQKARREWDDRYANLVLGKRNWQIAATGLLILSLVLAFGLVRVSTRSRFIPYIVRIDRLGYALAAPTALDASTSSELSTDQIIRYELAGFVRDARQVIADPQAEHQVIGEVYSRVRGAAYKFLENYYHEQDLAHDPFKVAQHQTVTVQIDSILPLSTSTWQVRWTEQALGLDGTPISTSHWEAVVDAQIAPPASDTTILDNPLGFYVTRISWTEQRS
jgi:type IV secretion system protein TrbF